ncbi:MAG: hypothetical protein D6681_08520 [Calditrichaeota bacterium]|nr:MAG: hypothetical protein D6681_08520 [Calditrichota bacterium]
MKKSLFYILIISLLYTGCAHNIYSVQQLEEDKSLFQKLNNKLVEVSMQNNERLIGYLHQCDKDSLLIFIPRAKVKNRKVALKDIKTIKIKRKEDPAIAVGIILALAFFYLMVESSASAAKTGTQ